MVRSVRDRQWLSSQAGRIILAAEFILADRHRLVSQWLVAVNPRCEAVEHRQRLTAQALPAVLSLPGKHRQGQRRSLSEHWTRVLTTEAITKVTRPALRAPARELEKESGSCARVAPHRLLVVMLVEMGRRRVLLQGLRSRSSLLL